MSERHKEILQSNHMALKELLSTDIDTICSFLWSRKIIRLEMKEEIEAEKTRSKKAEALLMLIFKKGSRAFEGLYEAAKNSELWEVADILKPDKRPHQMETDGPLPSHTSGNLKYPPVPNNSGDNSKDDDLPIKWPTLDALEEAKKICLVDPADTSMKQIFEKSCLDQGDVYVMKRRQRGTVLIINNFIFKDESLDDRMGSRKDVEALELLFGKFGFDVVPVADKTKRQMEIMLIEEAGKEEHKDADCFILFILSHGHEGIVFGTDGKSPNNGSRENFIEVERIWEIFCTSVSLQGKPKLLFIQACQGVKENRASGIGTGKGDPNRNSDGTNDSALGAANEPGGSGGTVIFDEPTTDTVEICKVTKDFLSKLQLPSTTQSDGPTATPTFDAHCLLAMSTMPGFVSTREEDYGSWFIQAVGYIFARFACKYDLLTLMTKVNNLVGRGRRDGKWQVAVYTSTLLRTFYFFPGLVRE